MRRLLTRAVTGVIGVLAALATTGSIGEWQKAREREQIAHAQIVTLEHPLPARPELCRRSDPCWVGSPQDRRQGKELQQAFERAGWLHVDSYQGFENCWFLFDFVTGRSMFQCYPKDGGMSGGSSVPDYSYLLQGG